jgi:hypothetical protein
VIRNLCRLQSRALCTAFFSALAVFIGGCQTAPDVTVNAIQNTDPEAVLAMNENRGWEEITILPGKRKTTYRPQLVDGEKTLYADADRSASGLQVQMNVDPNLKRFINFSWRAESLPDQADVSQRDADDSVVRVIVAFDGDKAELDNRDRAFFDQVKFFTGRDMPYATLMYVWSNNHPLEAVTINPHTKRVRKIVLGNKNSKLKTWYRFKRDLVADFTKAYGHKPLGKVRAVGIMTDADNTWSHAMAYYGGIKLTEN